MASGSEASRLAEDAAKAVHLLETLTGSKPAPTLTLEMPAGEVFFSKGVAFLFSKKAGVGLSFSSGRGMLFAKTGDMSWSAPLFFDVKTGGIGLSLGYSEIETIIILDDEKAIQDFLGTQATLTGNTAVALGDKVGTNLGETAINFSHLKDSYKTFEYSTSKGAILDISLSGAILTVSDEKNKRFYGEDVSRQDIVNGTVHPPEELGPLYNALNRLQSQGAAAASAE